MMDDDFDNDDGEDVNITLMMMVATRKKMTE